MWPVIDSQTVSEARDSQPGASVDTYTYSTEWADVDHSAPVWLSVLLLIVACSAN